MHDRPVRFDRLKAMRAADAALVAHRLYQQRRVAALPRGATQEQADAWRETWPPSGATEVETVVDAVIASGTPVEGIVFSREERDRITGWFVAMGDGGEVEILPEDRALFEKLEAL